MKISSQLLPAAAVLSAATLLLSACFLPQLPPGGTEQPSPGDGGPTMEEVAEDLKPFYHQHPDWYDCTVSTGSFRCAELTAPLDWDNPAGQTISITVVKAPAQGEAIGSLLTNPGGPGAATVESLTEYYPLAGHVYEFMFSGELLTNYDLILWDPRGTGTTIPVTCFEDDEARDRHFFDSSLEAEVGTDAYIEELKDYYTAYGAECLRLSGTEMEFIDSISTARDMDMIRAVIGSEKMNYLGFSYGAYLGGLYAELFPQKTGRIVLDAPSDPAVTPFESLLQQYQGFEIGFEQFIHACLTGMIGAEACPLEGDAESAQAQVKALMTALDESPVRSSDGRDLDGSSLLSAIASALYSEQMWPMLSTAFADLMNFGDPEMAFVLIDEYLRRDPSTGEYTDRIHDSHPAILCADNRSGGTEADWHTNYEFIKQELELFGEYLGYSEVMCSVWPFEPRVGEMEFTAAGSEPILVVGTLYDTATPYFWAEAMAAGLENGALLTVDGQGHTAYSAFASACVVDAVDRFLIDGIVPAEGKVCKA